MVLLIEIEAELRHRVGANIRSRRLTLGLNLKQASERALLHWRTWQKIECGVLNVGLSTLERMATAMGLDVEELMRKPVAHELRS